MALRELQVARFAVADATSYIWRPLFGKFFGPMCQTPDCLGEATPSYDGCSFDEGLGVVCGNTSVGCQNICDLPFFDHFDHFRVIVYLLGVVWVGVYISDARVADFANT